jgi:aminoglycoside phosphotransferase (APT) family kinase protein
LSTADPLLDLRMAAHRRHRLIDGSSKVTAMVPGMGAGECRMLDVDRMPRRIEEWLAHVGRPGAVLGYELMTGGYSRTMARVDIEWNDGSREQLVLRGDPPAELAMLESSRELEWALLSALTDIDRVQTPEARWFVDDEAWFGTAAIFIEHAAGTTLQAQLDAGLDHPPAARRMSATLAAIASVGPEELAHFPAMPDWDSYIDTQIARWRNLADSYVEALPIISYLAAWMDDNRPAPLPMRLVHGDPQAANILVSPTGEWNLVDWEFARIGDPREDLGYYNAYSGAVPPNLLAEDPDRFLADYRDATGFDETAVNPATLAWFTTLSTISVVQGMHDAIAGLANGTRSGTLVAFNSLLCTVGYAQFLGAIELIEAASANPASAR